MHAPQLCRRLRGLSTASAGQTWAAIVLHHSQHEAALSLYFHGATCRQRKAKWPTVAHVVVDGVVSGLVGGLVGAGVGQRRAARKTVEVGVLLLRCVVHAIVRLRAQE